LPLSAERKYLVLSPSMRTWSRWNLDCAPNGAPVRRWQARQWQIEILTASPLQLTRSFPQLHAAILLAMLSYLRRRGGRLRG